MKTLPEPFLTPMKLRRAKHELKQTETMGNPFGRVLRNILGAFLDNARPSSSKNSTSSLNCSCKNYLHSARELVNRSLDAADQADVNRQALIIFNRACVSFHVCIEGLEVKCIPMATP